MESENVWVSSGEAAEVVGFARTTIWEWFQRKDAPRHWRTPGGHLRIHLPEFRAWLSKMGRAQEPSA